MHLKTLTVIGLGLATPAALLADAPPISGTTLDVSANGEVTRKPDVATISAGVVTQATTSAQAMADNAKRMSNATVALRKAGVADRDISTASLSLEPQYRYVDNLPPVITGYQASNTLSVVFHDIAKAGPILDTLVGQGVNQINGPDFSVEDPEAALDEARVDAIKTARTRAGIYAKAAGLSVKRIVSISEASADMPQGPRPMVFAMARAEKLPTEIHAGEQKLSITVQVRFELQ